MGKLGQKNTVMGGGESEETPLQGLKWAKKWAKNLKQKY